MNIKIERDNAISTPEANFYSVYVDGEVVFECMAESEIDNLTIREIKFWYNHREV